MKSFTVVFIFGTLSAALGFPFVLELNLTPEQAQEYIKNPPGGVPNLAPKVATLPLVKWSDPRFRSGDGGPTNGHYWRNGHEIENTEDFVEDVYDASQFHGQDGLGAFAYGYSAPESFKAEQREHSGDVRGYYAYKNPGDLSQLIKVNYWADKEGFHQEDNLPKYQPEPVQETEEVRQARLAHEKAWHEAAEAAARNPDPQGEYDPKAYEYETQASGRNEIGLKPTLPEELNPNAGVPHRDAKTVERQHYEDNTVEPTSEPRGFFYSFHYDVPIIVAKSALDSQGRPLTGNPLDADTVGLERHVGSGPHDAQIPKRL